MKNARKLISFLLWTLVEGALIGVVVYFAVPRNDFSHIFVASLGILLVVTYCEGRYAKWNH